MRVSSLPRLYLCMPRGLREMGQSRKILSHSAWKRWSTYTFAYARQVSHVWATACEDETLYTSVTSYVDGLTRTQLRGLLRLTSAQACSYPHVTKRINRSHGISECYLYAPTTIARALRDLGGVEGLRRPPRVHGMPMRR